ncbi:MAG: TetR/AcrR family transcriptional regulator [Janthinobacterium lividum]
MAGKDTAEHTGIAAQILDTAQEMVQTRGYNGFSYADISAEVGLRKASIHYHYPSKTDLCLALVARYREEAFRKRAWIDGYAEGADHKLVLYTQIKRDMLRDGGRMCLCGALALDLLSLPSSVHSQVSGYFTESESWLAGVLEEGIAAGILHFEGSAAMQAQALQSGLAGAMLIARAHQDVDRYCTAAHQHLAQLGLDHLGSLED